MNIPKEPGWYWLNSASGRKGTRPHYKEIVRVYRDEKDQLVYSRVGSTRTWSVSIFPDGAPGWAWGNRVTE